MRLGNQKGLAHLSVVGKFTSDEPECKDFGGNVTTIIGAGQRQNSHVVRYTTTMCAAYRLFALSGMLERGLA